MATLVPLSFDPHPQPLPTRGRGVHRVRDAANDATHMNWSDRFLHALKQNEVRLVTYVPDNVLTPLISGAAADNYFMAVGAHPRGRGGRR
jgi:hypothetical protein